ncbi:cation diffusion facilitator family transporter [Leptolyngbya ohadii]|uniref:cation diffusion facilitator family transporter n=1 Tax=Leptolyngbya ohadii TaxID=1962290 RepID=UPI000B59F5A1|nr:cation diffusion facilitator family transporter [Leptolyngbya ohadii]
MHHHHGHRHDHPHGHHPSSRVMRSNRAFQIGILLNLGFVLVQATFGFLSNSLALVADAGHNLSDVLGLLIAWGASWLARRRPTRRYTYGFRRASIFSPLINSSVLLGVTGFIALEAVQRFLAPQPVASTTVIVVALVGIVVNGLTALLFHADRHSDVNIKGAFLHMAADALVSLGVVLSGVVIFLTGWQWVDPIASLIIGAVIALGAWSLLQEALSLALDGVPAQVSLRAIEDYLLNLPGVESIHDLHIWALSSTEPALTVHLVMLGDFAESDLLPQVNHDLHDRFGIEHSTIQIEKATSRPTCLQARCGA